MMKTKTAIILTFSKDDNRGANLQCYALQKTLVDLGIKVKFLDIQLPQGNLNIVGKIITFIKNICASSFRRKNNFAYTKKYTNIQELQTDPPAADLFIVGSDQVWNPDLTKRIDPRIYFFSFLDDSVKRISYAASFGTSDWRATEYDDEIIVLLSKFHKISVREDSGCEICRDIFKRSDVVQCIDPSLLLSRNDILRLIPGEIKPNKKIYSYLLYKSNEIYDIINDISSQTKHKVSGEYRDSGTLAKLKNLHGIEKWIKNIAEAELVVTNSFHTMAVSILLHKDFLIVPPIAGRETRLISLLQKLELEERYIGHKNGLDISSLSSINYKIVDEKLSKLRQASFEFLNSSL